MQDSMHRQRKHSDTENFLQLAADIQPLLSTGHAQFEPSIAEQWH